MTTLEKIKLFREEKGFLAQKDLKLLHATLYELGESMNEHLSCSLVKNKFCQTTVKEVL